MSQATDEDLLTKVRALRAEKARAEAERLAQTRQERGLPEYEVEWGKDAPTGCKPVRVTSQGQAFTGFVCFGRRAASRRRCEFCSEWSSAQCDFPVGGPCKKCKGKGKRSGGECHACAATGYEMCNKRICKRCRAHADPDEDFCPDHRVAAGFEPFTKRERCYWMKSGNHHGGQCLHKGCPVVLEPGKPALYFPQRHRLMCEPCGERYLELFK